MSSASGGPTNAESITVSNIHFQIPDVLRVLDELQTAVNDLRSKKTCLSELVKKSPYFRLEFNQQIESPSCRTNNSFALCLEAQLEPGRTVKLMNAVHNLTEEFRETRRELHQLLTAVQESVQSWETPSPAGA